MIPEKSVEKVCGENYDYVLRLISGSEKKERPDEDILQCGRDIVERGLSRLKREDQELIALKYLLKIKCSDIAMILNTTVNKVRVRLRRAKSALVEILDAQG
ncbi:MAG: hypothetical protein LBS10_07410 [Gracilibacteraceae bacterium]|nr:hypothetical protein [Gracilibacteraceae bacterium]